MQYSFILLSLKKDYSVEYQDKYSLIVDRISSGRLCLRGLFSTTRSCVFIYRHIIISCRFNVKTKENPKEILCLIDILYSFTKFICKHDCL